MLSFLLLSASTTMSVPTKDVTILFMGNSHTTMNNLYATVVDFLQSDSTGRTVKSSLKTGSTLDILWRKDIQDTIKNGKFDYVVLQGQAISMSHKNDYSKVEAISLAKLAKQSGAKVVFFAEWPRQGIDESDYIYNIYDAMAKESGATVAPICYSFDAAKTLNLRSSLWSSDGNHSSQFGAYLAAATLYYWIAGINMNPGLNLPKYQDARVRPLDKASAAKLLATARNTVVKYSKRPTAKPGQTR